MATRQRQRQRRRPKIRKKSKLVLVLLPILIFAAVLAWLFLEEVKQTLDAKPTQTAKNQPASSKKPGRKSTEKILDPERQKLDEILKNR